MRHISVELPTELVELLGSTPEAAGACLKGLGLIDLFRRGEVSSGYAARVLGMSKAEFISLLAEHEVPYLDASEEELRQQFEAAKPRRPRQATSPSRTQAP